MKKRCVLIALAAMLLVSMLSGCGGGMAGNSAAIADMAMPQEAPMPMPMEESEVYYSQSMDMAPVPEPSDSQAKIIYTAELNMETTDFDQAVTALADLTADLGGYYESSSVYSGGSGYRSANYTVRVPAEQYRAFLDQAGALCHMTHFYEYADDVSEVYYDMAGRLQTQQTKLARLQQLLAQAETMEDIITVESAISETEAQIERLSGELRRYDALVDYSTVTIYLSEVYRLSNVPEPVQGFSSRLGNALASGWQGFLNGMEMLLLALVYGWMWLLAAAVIAVIVALIVRRSARRRGGKTTPVTAEYTTPVQEKREE